MKSIDILRLAMTENLRMMAMFWDSKDLSLKSYSDIFTSDISEEDFAEKRIVGKILSNTPYIVTEISSITKEETKFLSENFGAPDAIVNFITKKFSTFLMWRIEKEKVIEYRNPYDDFDN